MKRRTILQTGLGLAIGSPLWAAMESKKWDTASNVLQQSTESGLLDAATLYVQQGDTRFSRSFGAAKTEHAVFLLASISKPISVAAIMTLFDRGLFQLEDPVRKFIPEFAGDGRDQITMRQLMTHVSGLPDQLPQNAELRSRHAGLDQFVEAAIRTPLQFAPGSRYRYSSMAILLAAEVAQRISGKSIADLADETVPPPRGKLLKPDTARMMIRNQNPAGIRPRGLGFDLGKGIAGPYLSDDAFGHGGSTGTLCWADPKTDTIFVVLTTLPANAAKPHPREITSRLVGDAIG